MTSPFQTFYNDSLIPTELLGEVSTTETDAFNELITSSSFLPRVQLFGGNSQMVKEEKIGLGRFGLVRTKDSVEDLGKTVTCCPLAWRFKAMQVTSDDVISTFDNESDEFKRIQAESETPDSGAMYGVEFLVWLPDSAEGEYATYYLSSKSARREAKPLLALIGQAATIECKLVSNTKYSWHAPKVIKSTTGFANLPDPVDLAEVVKKFKTPPATVKEGVTSDEAAATNTDRR